MKLSSCFLICYEGQMWLKMKKQLIDMLRRIKVETKRLLFDMLRRMNVVEKVKKQLIDMLRRIKVET